MARLNLKALELSHAIWGLFWSILIQNWKKPQKNTHIVNQIKGEGGGGGGWGRLLRPLWIRHCWGYRRSEIKLIRYL